MTTTATKQPWAIYLVFTAQPAPIFQPNHDRSPRLDFFESDPMYRHMSKEEKSILSTACSVQNFAAGEVILREGEVGEWMFIVIEGTVKIVDQLRGKNRKKPEMKWCDVNKRPKKAKKTHKNTHTIVTCNMLFGNILSKSLGTLEFDSVHVKNLDFFLQSPRFGNSEIKKPGALLGSSGVLPGGDYWMITG